MSDYKVRETETWLDKQAMADERREKQIQDVKYYLDRHEFNLLSEKAETDFIDWYADKYEDGTYAWFVSCEKTSSWYCNNVEVDTLAVATKFVEWIGEE